MDKHSKQEKMINPEQLNQPIIFFTKGTGFWEKRIMAFTKTAAKLRGIKVSETYSHVSLLVKDKDEKWIVIETNPTLGVRIKDFNQNENRMYRQFKFKPLSEKDKLVDQAKIQDMVCDAKYMAGHGLKYNYGAIFGQLLNTLTGIWIGKKQRTDKVYCSQLVAYLLYRYFGLQSLKDYNSIDIIDLQINPNFIEV